MLFQVYHQNIKNVKDVILVTEFWAMDLLRKEVLEEKIRSMFRWLWISDSPPKGYQFLLVQKG